MLSFFELFSNRQHLDIGQMRGHILHRG